MSDISYDIEWFKRQAQQWDEFCELLAEHRQTLWQSRDLPGINERFPDTVKAIVPALNRARYNLQTSLGDGITSTAKARDLIYESCKRYIETNAINDAEVAALTASLGEPSATPARSSNSQEAV